MTWWSWERWEAEIDWMALHGINLPMAFTGAVQHALPPKRPAFASQLPSVSLMHVVLLAWPLCDSVPLT